MHRLSWLFLIMTALVFSLNAHASLFADDEARRAILQLREQVSTLQSSTEQAKNDEVSKRENDVSQLRRSLMDLQTQINQLQTSLQTLEGKNEELAHHLAQVEDAQKAALTALNGRVKNMEPTTVTVDGRQFQTTPEEKSMFDAAVSSFQNGDFKPAIDQFNAFINQYGKTSGYYPATLFWKGNAQYALSDFKSAVTTLRTLLALNSDDSNLPNAYMVLANSQLELANAPAGKKTLQTLIEKYPKSGAAVSAKQRLKQL